MITLGLLLVLGQANVNATVFRQPDGGWAQRLSTNSITAIPNLFTMPDGGQATRVWNENSGSSGGGSSAASDAFTTVDGGRAFRIVYENITGFAGPPGPQGPAGPPSSGFGGKVFVPVTLDGTGFYIVTSTGQTWVTSSSAVVCGPVASDDAGLTAEAVAVGNLQTSVGSVVPGVGFDLVVFSPNGLEGLVQFQCIGTP